MFRSMWKLHDKRKSAYKMLKQMTFFKLSLVPKLFTGIFNVSNVCTNM